MRKLTNRQMRWIIREMRKVEVKRRAFRFEDEIDMIIEKRVTKFGAGAKLDCAKEFIGRRAYILISKD